MIRINISFVLILLAFVSCSKKESTVQNVSTKELSSGYVDSSDSIYTIDTIVVPMKLSSSSFTMQSETDDEIVIAPCTPYYKEWVSSKRMTLDHLSELGYCDDLDYPVLDIYIINNTNQTISVNSLDFNVKESKIDKMPYIYICNNASYYNIAYSGIVTYYNRLIMRNESWFDWGEMNIDYKIMRKDEVFNGKYDRRKTIPYFEDEYLVDFTQDFIDMGLNMKFILDHQYDEYSEGLFDRDDYSIEDLSRFFYPFEIEEYDYGVCGFARIYGKISFTKSKFTKDFYGVIYITPPGSGAADGFDDIFDVKLDYNRLDYTISYPYITTLKPGDNESVRLTIKCPRSSNHNFYISIKNDNGLVMRTKDVKMHYLNGRHSTKQPMYTERQPY